MKILFLSAANSTHTVRWVNALAKRGHEVHLVSNRGHEPQEDILDLRVQVHIMKHSGMKGYYLNAAELKKIERRLRPDVINVHYASGYGTLARKAHIKNYILSIWGSDVYEFPYEGKLKNYILKKNVSNASFLASTSNCMALQLKKVMNNYDLDVFITPFGVDLNIFNPRDKDNTKKNEIIIGTIKALEDVYGIDELILAFDKVKQELARKQNNQKVKLYIYGSGSKKEQYEALVKRKNLQEDVLFKGKIPNLTVPKALSELDIFCALSRKESFGVAAIEAMSMKKPVVVSDADGFKEVVENEKTGLIVPRGNLEAAKEAILKLIYDQKYRNILGEKGRKRVEDNYDWEKNVNTMVELYKKVSEAL